MLCCWDCCLAFLFLCYFALLSLLSSSSVCFFPSVFQAVGCDIYKPTTKQEDRNRKKQMKSKEKKRGERKVIIWLKKKEITREIKKKKRREKGENTTQELASFFISFFFILFLFYFSKSFVRVIDAMRASPGPGVLVGAGAVGLAGAFSFVSLFPFWHLTQYRL